MSAQLTTEDTPPAPKPMNPRRLRQTLYWLALDWIHLQQLPPHIGVQQFGDVARTSNVKTYGHPQEWASDKARTIVDNLTEWHDYLAEHRGETRPRRKLMRHRHDEGNTYDIWAYAVNDKQRLTKAWTYLEPRCEQLTQIAEPEALKELPDLHHGIRRTLGLSAPKYTLPVPCPNNDCQLLTLTRTQGIDQDFITCDNCNYTIKAAHYPLLVRMALEAVVETTARPT